MKVLEEGENYANLDRVTADKYNGEVRYKYQYDSAGNLGFYEDLVNGVKHRYVYDLSDRLVKVTYSKGNTLSYGYDKDNKVNKVTEKIGTETYVTSYTFDNDNRIKTITFPKSTNTISYAYDSIGRLKTSTIVIGTSQFVTTNNYDAGGKLQSVNLPGGRSISYTYDGSGNIETITEAGKVIKYYYNELKELIREDSQILDKTIAYSYDEGGSIKSKIEYVYTTDIVLSNPVKTISYEYGDANWKDKLTAHNGILITYATDSEDIGNPIQYGDYKYNWEGRQ